jgi:dihydropyrimidinase
MFDLLIANGQVVSPSLTITADVGIRGEKIAGIFEPGTPLEAYRTIDATGLYVLPGGIDPHTHYGMRFGNSVTRDHYREGTLAAAFGGTTTFIDFAFQEPGSTLIDIFRKREAEAKGQAVIDYAFHSGITDGSASTIREMAEMISLGVPSFKLFTVYREANLFVDDATLFAVFREAARIGALPVVHAENEHIVNRSTRDLLSQGNGAVEYYAGSRPRVAEIEAVQRIMLLAREASSAVYFVHITCKESVEAIRQARRQGYPVYGETCPHYLTLTDEVYQKNDGYNYIMAPPLRRTEDNHALWEAIRELSIATVASDESSWHTTDKARGKTCFDQAPPGLVGTETRLPVLFSQGVSQGKISINRFVALSATNPAKLFGLYPRKGILAVGSDADIVLIDPDEKIRLEVSNIHHGAGYSPYGGLKGKGVPITTISRGRIIMENREFIDHPGHGKFIQRSIKPEILAEPIIR